MNHLVFDLFPNGKRRAVTFSYDDGRVYDRRLVEIFDKYGAKCTFNLNSWTFGNEKYIDADFVRSISDRHEIACHAYSHPFLERLPKDRVIAEIYEDRRALEEIIHKPVVGMAYPYGTTDGDVKAALKACGIKYARTTAATRGFGYPDDFLAWHPTCHHRDSLGLADDFLNKKHLALSVFYVWGHSYEFNNDNNWELMDELLKKLSESSEIWYATNTEIYDYYQSVKSLRITLDGSAVVNPTATTVYASLDKKIVEIKPGLTKLV